MTLLHGYVRRSEWRLLVLSLSTTRRSYVVRGSLGFESVHTLYSTYAVVQRI